MCNDRSARPKQRFLQSSETRTCGTLQTSPLTDTRPSNITSSHPLLDATVLVTATIRHKASQANRDCTCAGTKSLYNATGRTLPEYTIHIRKTLNKTGWGKNSQSKNTWKENNIYKEPIKGERMQEEHRNIYVLIVRHLPWPCSHRLESQNT